MELSLVDSHLELQPDLSDLAAKTLDISWNTLKILYWAYLPIGIESFTARGNQLGHDALEPNLPLTLRHIDLSSNYISYIQFAHSLLQHINISKNNISILDANSLPTSLLSLIASNSLLKKIEYLPPGLKKLDTTHTYLFAVPNTLPTTLETWLSADCYFVSRGLPTKWGASLRTLDLSRNRLTRIPAGLPDSLHTLLLHGNQIQEVYIGDLPPYLKILGLNANRIRRITSKRRHTPIQCTFLNNNQITEYPSTSTPWTAAIEFRGNWCFSVHVRAARLFQRLWRSYKLLKTLRTRGRTRTLRDELLATSMAPERAGRYEQISPEWNFHPVPFN